MSKEEQINPDAMNIALLREIQKHMISMNEDIQAVRRNQEPNNVHLKYEVDLSVAHTDEEIADFLKVGVKINSLTVLRLPSAMSIRLAGLSSEKIDLEAGEYVSISEQKITRLLVSNTAGTGIARIHVFGRFK
jgi:hypothetical protein